MYDSESLPKVLIVNDDASTLLALTSVLSDPSITPQYDVFTVLSGEEALREVLKHDFAVILLDVSMPVMNGFETAEAIHSHPRSASVPIIFITAYYGDEFNRMKAYQKGAADYLFAPIIPQIVQSKVAVFVELNQKNLELKRKTAELEAINTNLRQQRLNDLEQANINLKAEVEERKLAELRANELATRDPLTGLFNRRSLLESLKHAIAQATRRNEGLALMFLDLDKFKEINDSFGHEAGDELLRQVAERLIAAVRESDIVARLGGDEFVILLQGFPSANDVVKVANKIVAANANPYLAGEHSFTTSTTIGISFYPQDGETAESLLKNADAAMYHAKQQARGSIQIFHDDLKIYEQQRNQFENEVKDALKHNQFVLYYQPKIRIACGSVSGVEALLYWQHPSRGLIGPGEFLTKAVQTGQAHLLGEWIIYSICAQIRSWQQAGVFFDLPIAISLNAFQLHSELVKMISRALAEHDLAPSCLQLEVTESLIVRDLSKVMPLLRDISEAGISIVIDGFGAGFSSMALLKTLPISSLKIDPCFINNTAAAAGDESMFATFPQDTSVISVLLSMARVFGLNVVAEGVETKQQMEVLKALGCDEYQGTFFSEPLRAELLISYLQEKNIA